jgi:hypothetical protein
MSNYATLKNNIRLVIRDYYVNNPIPGVAVLPVVWKDQNRSRPNLPYVSVKILTTPTFGHANVGQPDNTGDATTNITKTFITSTQFYSNDPGIDPVEKLEDLIFYLKSHASKEDLQPLDIAYMDNSEVNDISALLDQNNIEARANTDITFGGSYSKTENLGVVEDVNFSGTYEDPA